MDQENYNAHSSSRKRHDFSDVQLKLLETAFLENHFPNQERKIELAQRTELTLKQIRQWFLNRRRKEKFISKRAIDNEMHCTSSQRPSYSKFQLDTLNEAFLKNRYVEKGRRTELAKTTGLTEIQIRQWFINQRKRSDFQRTNPFFFTSAQRAILVEVFAEDNYPNKEKREDLAERTKLTEQQIRTWFMHERNRVQKRSEQEIQAASNDVENVQKKSIDVTPDQEAVLMDMFLKHRWLNKGELADMVERTGLEKEQVKKWFKRQRKLKDENEVVIKEEPEDEME